MQFLDILTCIISVYILFLFSFVRTDESNDIAVKLEIVYKDEGQNVTLKCSNGSLNGSIWIVSDENSKFAGLKPRSPNSAVLKDGSFFISDLSSSDSHLYTCQDVETNKSLRIVKLIVKSVPPSVNNLTIIPHSVYALVTWELHGNGGYPIKNFLLQYRKIKTENDSLGVASPTSSSWMKLEPIEPNASSTTVYRLEPNVSYFFRMQAVNILGAGHEVTVMAKTKYDIHEINEAKELQSVDSEPSTNIYMKVTIVAICLVIVTFAILSLGISLVLFRHCGKNVHTELRCEASTEEEVLELVPHITLNPSFNIDMLEYIEAEVSPTDACERTSLVQPSNDTSSKSGLLG